jgi:predicted DNA-binding protein
MGNTIAVRLPDDLAEWLNSTATQLGVSQGKIIRDQLEKARAVEDRPFLRLAGKVAGSVDLSVRKGFSKTGGLMLDSHERVVSEASDYHDRP